MRTPAASACTAQLGATRRGHLGDSRRERERGHFEAGVAKLGDAGTNAGVLPALERFVANRVLHGRVNSRARPDGSRGSMSINSIFFCPFAAR